MPKTIHCNKCHKEVKVDETYPFKVCPFCSTKIKSKRELERESKKVVKSLKFKTSLPNFLKSFGNYCREMKKLWGNKEISFWDYEKSVREHKLKEIRDESDKQILELRKGEHELKRKLRFDLYPRLNQDCEKVRMMYLKEQTENNQIFIEEHLFECEECRLWLNNFNESFTWEYQKGFDIFNPQNPQDEVKKQRQEHQKLLEIMYGEKKQEDPHQDLIKSSYAEYLKQKQQEDSEKDSEN